MFKSDLNTAERLQASIEAHTIEAETRAIAYPCYGNEPMPTDMLYDKALAVANDFEQYIDLMIDGSDFDNYLS